MIYTANWKNKETVLIFQNEQVLGTIEFDKTNWAAYCNATLEFDGKILRAQLTEGNNITITINGTEVFTSIFDKVWGNLELRSAGDDTGYDIKGRWFKPGTRLTDEDDRDLIVVKSDVWSGKNMTIEVLDETVSPIMIVATLYHHIRASAAKTMQTLLATAAR